jgi:brefeldin A-inhibited guanine nucleotide-exchange protein
VDLFGQFYPALRPMLPRLLALLAGFMARSHAALASVGVAASARLVANCGPHMDAATWGEVVGGLRGVVDATIPDAAGLVTPPARGSSGSGSSGDLLSPPTSALGGQQQQQQQQQQGGGGGGSGGGAGTPRPPYTLREGVGMRRLGRFRVHAGVQLLLAQAMGEMYAREHGRMPVRGADLGGGCWGGITGSQGATGSPRARNQLTLPHPTLAIQRLDALNRAPYSGWTGCAR